ncbi:RagB/SusD family nutrient uptake outer membrane protein [Shivajiella indica]|uniref:RagB/SusD family nutrient uptake outer membrane protein n=1 Tax=Shivajiella indica TaxID=872115 RepID=A0ABW5BCC2_9BACT
MNRYKFPILLNLTLIFLFVSCDDFLDEKPNRALVTMDSLNDLQGLLDNTLNVMNQKAFLQLFVSDEFYTNSQGLAGLQPYLQKAFTYQHPPFEQDLNLLDWRTFYRQIFYANIVLDEINKIVPVNSNEEEIQNQIKGQAHFHRAFAYFGLVQLFSPPFGPAENNSQRSIPVRKSPDPNVLPMRPDLSEIYGLIAEDLNLSVQLLPDKFEPKTRPSKMAAHAMLARTYLTKSEYQNAKKHAEAALAIESTLIDFNSLNLSLLNPFAPFNIETVFYVENQFNSFLTGQLAMVNPLYLSLYKDGDLRRSAYFTERPTGWVNFTGYLTGTNRYFAGISTSEIYLILSECYIREGDFLAATELLKKLEKSRFKEGFSTELEINSEQEGLEYIMEERIRELFGRGTVWTDIRRFNLDSRFQRSISKTIDDTVYELPLNDPRFTLPVPPREVELDNLN